MSHIPVEFEDCPYTPVLMLVEGRYYVRARIEEINGQQLVVLPDQRISIGLHSEVRVALGQQRLDVIWEFAQAVLNDKQSTVVGREGYRIFPDGVIIRNHDSG